MYLQSFTLKNFRKFGEKDNEVFFVNSNEIKNKSLEQAQNKTSNHSKENSSPVPLISPSSTLIIGKNNTGKTTITNALKKLHDNKMVTSSDFNLDYLKNLVGTYVAAFQNHEEDNTDIKLETPKIEFELKVKLENFEEDLISNLSPFVTLDDLDKKESIVIKANYSIKEEESFLQEVRALIQAKAEKNKAELAPLEKICNLLDDKDKTKYKLSYRNNYDEEVTNFSLSNLIKIKCIDANRNLKEDVLSSIFQKIVVTLFMNEENKDVLNEGLNNINGIITSGVEKKNKSVSEILREIEQPNHFDMQLRGNVSKDDILNKLIKYSFREGEDYIPENQFGLGYINLVNIIGEIVHYIHTYPEASHHSHINLLLIEEPEAFMHPQMQEFFIKRIDSAVNKVLEQIQKPDSTAALLKCQIIITTHSSHIVNSKIHSSNSFNNINYLTIKDRCSTVIPLYDALLSKGEASNEQEQNFDNIADNKLDSKELIFLKKHIKYKVSELFFSDAVIFVEGGTEELLLNYYLEHDEVLKKYYISIFRIDGAHAKVYYPLIKQLQIPCLIITDIDIKRTDCEKNKTCNEECPNNKDGHHPKSFKQVTSLKGRKTTNKTLKELLRTEKLDNVEYIESENILVVFQKDPIQQQYATSLEEAIILTNYDHRSMVEILKTALPKLSKDFIQNKKIIKKRSFEIQHKINNNVSKTEFASSLLFTILTSGTDPLENTLTLPEYIQYGLNWLKNQLNNK